jgi:hypothetical protein
MPKENLASACGTYCGTCRFLGVQCAGCTAVQGKPFWTGQYKLAACRLYDCCVNQHHHEHCGECAELPCALFKSASDPAYTPEEAKANMEQRVQVLRERKAIGTPAWVKARDAR